MHPETSPTPVMATPPAGEPLIRVDHVIKEFAVTRGLVLQRQVGSVKAVSDVSFTVAEKETFGIVGESGCGKTTIGRLLVGLEHPDSGNIVIDGGEVGRKSFSRKARGRLIQMMFQDPQSSLNPRMRVRAIIEEPLVIHQLGSRDERRGTVDALLGEVGLAPRLANRYPHELSGGQRQRIGLARALALRPRIIVADEPVSALDVSIRSQILNLMHDLQTKHNLTYVIISHDLSVVRYMAHRIGVVYLGKLVELSPSDTLYHEPAHPYTKGLINAIPLADPAIERNKERLSPTGELPSSISPPSGCRYRTRCPLAQAVCTEAEPPLQEIRPQHLVACHFPLIEGSSDDGAGPLRHGGPADR